jgi:hypothetical protein
MTTLLFGDQIAKICKQALIRLEEAGVAAGRILHHILKLLGEGGDLGGFLLELLELAGVHRWVEDDVANAEQGMRFGREREPEEDTEPEIAPFHIRTSSHLFGSWLLRKVYRLRANVAQ